MHFQHFSASGGVLHNEHTLLLLPAFCFITCFLAKSLILYQDIFDGFTSTLGSYRRLCMEVFAAATQDHHLEIMTHSLKYSDRSSPWWQYASCPDSLGNYPINVSYFHHRIYQYSYSNDQFVIFVPTHNGDHRVFEEREEGAQRYVAQWCIVHICILFHSCRYLSLYTDELAYTYISCVQPHYVIGHLSAYICGFMPR